MQLSQDCSHYVEAIVLKVLVSSPSWYHLPPSHTSSTAAEGAQRIYIEGIRPWLLRYQPALDHGLAALLHTLVSAG